METFLKKYAVFDYPTEGTKERVDRNVAEEALLKKSSAILFWVQLTSIKQFFCPKREFYTCLLQFRVGESIFSILNDHCLAPFGDFG